MPSSDLTRSSQDLRQRYKAVVMQQGRVMLDRDFNALQEIIDGRMAADALDEIGPCGSPDNGFTISLPDSASPGSIPSNYSSPDSWDFLIAPGTMYVGGQRVFLPGPGSTQPPWSYFNQPDWIHPTPPAFGRASQSTPPSEYVYLHVYEQEVGAVEDSDLLDVALGGPDTTQRVRLMWRVIRMPVNADDCASALKQAEAAWAANGFQFDPSTMRLLPQAMLQVGFTPSPAASSPCNPTEQGGYLGADNQLIRLQVSDHGTKGESHLLWGYDNASFLYRVSPVSGDLSLQLNQPPVDAFHSPRTGQVVELLRTAVILGIEPDATDPTGQQTIKRCVAEATGFVTTVSSYSNTDYTVTLKPAPPASYLNDENPLFLRIWQGRQPIHPATQPITLTDPTTQTSLGIQVTITVPTGGSTGAALPSGAFWMIAVRPSTPQAVYPERFLTGPQLPDGPRQWICPLAVIDWAPSDFASIPASSIPTATIYSCRCVFENLVELTRRQLSGCCSVSVRPEDLTATKTLQSVIDKAVGAGGIGSATICLMPGIYNLPEPLRLDSRHSYLTIEACHDGSVLRAAPGSEARFVDGLIVMERANCVNLRGLRLEPPPVPFGKASVGAAKLVAAEAVRIFNQTTENLSVSVAIRPIHCALLKVEGCLFRFSLKPQTPQTPLTNVLSVGIFAVGPTWGLTLERNRFIREEKYLRSTRGYFRLICGFLLAPAVVPNQQTFTPQISEKSAGSYLSPLLDGASLVDNEFAGLTIAVLILSDCGVVRFERNRVRDCLNGYISLSLEALILLLYWKSAAAEEASTDVSSSSSSILAVLGDNNLELAVVLILLYPLPTVTVGHGPIAIAVSSTATATKRIAGTKQLIYQVSPKFQKRAVTTLLTRVGQLITNAGTIAAKISQAATAKKPSKKTTSKPKPTTPAAPATSPAAPEATVPPPSISTKSTVGAPADRAEKPHAERPTTPSHKEHKTTKAESTGSPSTVPATSEVSSTSTASSTPQADLKLTSKAGNPVVSLTQLDRIFLLGGRMKTGLKLSLHFSGNDIDATVSNGPSGAALIVIDEEFRTGKVEVCGNFLRNRFGLPTAMLIMANGTCVVTGNTIINAYNDNFDSREAYDEKFGFAFSLLVDMTSSRSGDPAAITGNCLRGEFIINPPQRPEIVPSPMNFWNWFNANF